jgi:hypothetical protein
LLYQVTTKLPSGAIALRAAVVHVEVAADR